MKFCRTKPVIQFSMFRAGMFCSSQFNGLLTAFARGIVLFAAIFLFQGPFGSSPFDAGMFTFLSPSLSLTSPPHVHKLAIHRT